MKDQYATFIRSQNLEGSNKASSYIRALDLLNQIIRRSSLFGHQDFWSIDSVAEIGQLYEYALSNQKVGGSVFLHASLPPSYGKNGYYSAALKTYSEFLVLHQYKENLWKLYESPGMDPAQLGQRLYGKRIQGLDTLVAGQGFDLASKEGKEVLRQTKARVNQDFFRDMILRDYGQQCCVTGLNVPGVLRASHIVAWRDDAKNRLNPANGLCLSATYDAAFDRHLISFDDDYRMILSPLLREFHSNTAFKIHFKAYEGHQVILPVRFPPGQQFLETHREMMAK
jgi:putative restriction endonuclease